MNQATYLNRDVRQPLLLLLNSPVGGLNLFLNDVNGLLEVFCDFSDQSVRNIVRTHFFILPSLL